MTPVLSSTGSSASTQKTQRARRRRRGSAATFDDVVLAPRGREPIEGHYASSGEPCVATRRRRRSRNSATLTPRSGSFDPRALTPSGALLDVVVPDHEDVGDLLELGLADPRAQRLARRLDADAQTVEREGLGDVRPA